MSHDDGATFQENRAVPGVLALAQRDGILYAAADNFADGFALGASSDEGATWQPVVRFDQIASIVRLPAHERPVPGELRSARRQGVRIAGQDLGGGGLHRDPTTGSGGSAGAGTAGTTGGAAAHPGADCAVEPRSAGSGSRGGLVVAAIGGAIAATPAARDPERRSEG